MTKLALAALLIGLVACDGGGSNVIPTDADPDPLRCDPRTQTGCEAGQKCANRLLLPEPNVISEITCVPDGTVELGGACEIGPAGALGYSDCRAGGECVNDICKQICDHQGGSPKCAADHACATYTNVLESNGMSVAGLCEPRCDPLTQELASGTNIVACGSTDPAMPDRGCYTQDRVDFICARIPEAARDLTDRMRGYGPASGGVYVNGCAAGYMSVLAETTGSMVRICSGICAPASSNNSTPETQENALGDVDAVVKLHDKATAEAGDGLCTQGKKGSAEAANCYYLWGFNTNSSGMIRPSPYNDTTGICVAYGKYTFTVNGMQASWPDCAQLPPAGGTEDPIYGFANEWPCVPTTEISFTGTMQAKVNPALRDLRLGARPGPGVRHLLRQE